MLIKIYFLVCHHLHGVEKVTEIGTEAWLTCVTLRSLSGLVKNGSTTLSDFMNKGGPKNFYDLPLNGKIFGAMVAYESTIADVAAAHGVQVVGGSVAEALDKTAKWAPILAMSNGQGGSDSGGGPNQPINAGNVSNPPGSSSQAKYKIPMQGINNISPDVAKLNYDKQYHIQQLKHGWDRLVYDPLDWDAIARIITKVMREGIEAP